jgi:tRNA-dihydrouridine synthase B
MLNSLRLGQLELPTNLIQGPLAGYSCAPFRLLINEFGGVAYTTTEMISAYELAHNCQQPKRYTYKHPNEGKLCYQISGDNADDLARAVEVVVAKGADLVDLNCGCPQRKIRKKGHGSKLLSDPESLYQLLSAMRKSSSVTMSAKIRVDGDSGESFNAEVVAAIESAGMDFMIVHGRHWRERYEVAVRLDEIANIVSMASIPVIANGDVSDVDSLREVFSVTKAAGVMISRASIGKPWLFAELTALWRGHDYPQFSEVQKRTVLRRHIEMLVELDGEHSALLQARSLAKHYCEMDISQYNFSRVIDLYNHLSVF